MDILEWKKFHWWLLLILIPQILNSITWMTLNCRIKTKYRYDRWTMRWSYSEYSALKRPWCRFVGLGLAFLSSYVYLLCQHWLRNKIRISWIIKLESRTNAFCCFDFYSGPSGVGCKGTWSNGEPIIKERYW